ncbi:MAG: hypothetical protein R3362_10780 [Rhodothermales bacterium]|nr:hypothetical protein [Rhodothermales bacterium]
MQLEPEAGAGPEANPEAAHPFVQTLADLGPEETGAWLLIVIPAVFLLLKESVGFVRWMRDGAPKAPDTADAAALRAHIALLQDRVKRTARRGRVLSLLSAGMAAVVLAGGVFFQDATTGWVEEARAFVERAEGIERELAEVRPVDVTMTGDYVDVGFVRGPSGDYDRPADPAFAAEVQALVERLRRQRPGALPVLFLTSHASRDGARAYNVSIASTRGDVVEGALRQRGLAIGDVRNGFLRASGLDDKVVRVEVGFLEG